jgi:hypothetical protein
MVTKATTKKAQGTKSSSSKSALKDSAAHTKYAREGRRSSSALADSDAHTKYAKQQKAKVGGGKKGSKKGQTSKKATKR